MATKKETLEELKKKYLVPIEKAIKAAAPELALPKVAKPAPKPKKELPF